MLGGESRRRIAVVIGTLSWIGGLTAATAEDLFFVGTRGNHVWKGSWDGSAVATAIYSPATPLAQGPIGVAWAGPGEPVYFSGGRANEGVYSGDEHGAAAPVVLPASTGSLPGSDIRHDVAVDVIGERVFFSIRDSGIFSCVLPCAGAADAVAADGSTYVGIEYEPISDRVYFSRTGGDIGWVPADGSAGTTVLFDALDGVESDATRHLILDPSRNRMYWAQHEDGSSGTGEILGANLDGSGAPVVLYTSPAPFLPFGVELDVLDNRLYWTEFDDNSVTSNDRVMVAPADGSGMPAVLYAGNFGSIRGIVLGRAVSPVEIPTASGAGLAALAVALALAAMGRAGSRGRRGRPNA